MQTPGVKREVIGMARIIFGVALVAIALAAIGSAVINLQVASTTRQIHKLVNSRMTAVLERVDQLTRALERSDIEVPPDPNPQD